MLTHSLRRGVWILVATVGLASMTGCEIFNDAQPKTESPFTNEPATAGEIAAQSEKWQREQELEELKARQAAETAQREADTQAKRDARRIQAALDLEVAKIRSEVQAAVIAAEARVAEAKAQAQADLDESGAEAQAKAEAALANLVQLQARIDLDVNAKAAAIESANADLKRRAQERQASWSFFRSVVAAVPGLNAVPGVAQAQELVGGLLTASLSAAVTGVPLIVRGRRQKAALAAKADEADKQAEAAQKAAAEAAAKAKAERIAHLQTYRAAGGIVDSIDMLKKIDPAVKAALAQHASEIDEWQGYVGKRLVNRLQSADETEPPPADLTFAAA